jgi:hypothetical protein
MGWIPHHVVESRHSSWSFQSLSTGVLRVVPREVRRCTRVYRRQDDELVVQVGSPYLLRTPHQPLRIGQEVYV